MPTPTRQRPPTTNRFGRPATRTTSPRVNVRRRPPQPTGLSKLLHTITRTPSSGRKKSPRTNRNRSSAAKNQAGAALLFSAAGLAIKNRDKLTTKLRRKNTHTNHQPTPTPTNTAGPHPLDQPPHNTPA